MNQKLGKASVRPEQPVYILNSGSVVGTKEGQGPLGLLFDTVGEDDMFGCATWEEAESSLQKDAVYLALTKAGLKPEDVSFIFAGDLLGQSIATSFGISAYQIPLLGVYGACSTCGESLTLGTMSIAGGFADKVVCVTSSHFASAEKEFRFPLDYGSQRPLSATWTVTGSGAFVLGNEDALQSMKGSDAGVTGTGRKARARITGMTVGKIVDYGLKDSMNMGACMAPAAASTLEQHFIDYGSQPDDYDKIITGDLGKVGQRVLIDLLRERGYDISTQHMDCGIEIFDGESQDTHAGGSGCGCSAVTLSAYILKQLEERNWKKVLFMPTGALLSKTSFNEGKSVPGIAHALVLESV
ncbi:stage V sporulation protein AD [Lachnospiraceae bacterium]|jgi:stage V sporulation protein AD|nr:stage V sporulation protein AD [Lachnospiraceae bacterium]MCX4304528.1 stage V sporulation protein AD [Acetatifactor sp.]GFI66156.1 stage V sporulation protein AD [Lachnospiraceae bacterium]